MTVYRYSQEEKYTNIIHPLTDWHTTEQGAYDELIKKHPEVTSPDQVEDDLERTTVVVD